MSGVSNLCDHCRIAVLSTLQIFGAVSTERERERLFHHHFPSLFTALQSRRRYEMAVCVDTRTLDRSVFIRNHVLKAQHSALPGVAAAGCFGQAGGLPLIVSDHINCTSRRLIIQTMSEGMRRAGQATAAGQTALFSGWCQTSSKTAMAETQNSAQAGTLYLIPSPLGDEYGHQDFSPSLVALADSLQHFIVENEKSARRFLKRLGVTRPIAELKLSVLDEHTRKGELPALLEPLKQGNSVGLISEAGCPCVADPGADLVALAHSSGIRVKPLAGSSSILLALMASGLNGQSFVFHGLNSFPE